jgi:hypothetical protein
MSRLEQVTVPIETARSHLDEEITQLRAEQQAFERCAERVAALTVQPSQSATTSAVTPIAETPAAATTHDVWAAYHETVMALAHYDDVYGDSLTTSLAQEFGAKIATALGEDIPLTGLLQQRVYTAATQAAAKRAAMLERLADEQSTLETAHDTLATLAQQAAAHTGEADLPDEAATAAPSLETIETRCEQLATDRQHQLQSRSLSFHIDGHDTATYLYQDTDWTYPVLAAVARLSDQLRTN